MFKNLGREAHMKTQDSMGIRKVLPPSGILESLAKLLKHRAVLREGQKDHQSAITSLKASRKRQNKIVTFIFHKRIEIIRRKVQKIGEKEQAHKVVILQI